MTQYEKALEMSRLEPKLKLWNTPGFFQFLKDLQDMKGPEIDILQQVESLKKIYLNRMKELHPKTKFVQGKLGL